MIRQHGSLSWEPRCKLQAMGKTETGELFEQQVSIRYGDKVLSCRRVVLKLFNPTRDGDTLIAILTNLPTSDAGPALERRSSRGG